MSKFIIVAKSGISLDELERFENVISRDLDRQGFAVISSDNVERIIELDDIKSRKEAE